jgi:hypothetical protein
MLPPIDPLFTIYESYEGVTGGDRQGFSASQGDDDGDGLRDEDFQNGYDDDGDNAIDEDYESISQQMFSCEYWDNTEEARSIYPDHRPLNLRVRQRSFAWSTPGANEFIGFDYVVLNQGFETLREIFLGYFVDSDAGNKSADSYWTDDGGELAQIDTVYVDRSITYSCTDRVSEQTRHCNEQELNIDIAFMFDTPGTETGGNSADDMPEGSKGYFGGMFLGHTTDPFGERAPAAVGIHTLAFFSGSGTYPEGDPTNDYQRYDLLQRGTIPARPTGQPSDYRYCFSAGPFSELLPGEELNFQVAFVIGNEREGVIHNAIMAQRVFDGQWSDVDNLVETGCGGRETCLHIEEGGDPLFWDDPCDSLAPPEGPFKNVECDDPDVWRDADCNCCTPIREESGACGKETLVHWVGTVAPPPPAVNLEDPELRVRPGTAGDRRIRVEWNNASELVADPIQQRILFAGYKIWRVEGWQRPTGSTGPSPDEWQLLAVLTPTPIGTELDLADFTDWGMAFTDSVADPENEGEFLYSYPVGRYFYEDTVGLKNGMIYFYDVTAYSAWYDESGTLQTLSSQAAAVEAEGVRPMWDPVTEGWKDQVMVVPNPWYGGAAWDLTPSDADPTGTNIAFAKLPERDCQLRIYTLAGDLVRTLDSERRGTVFWNMISRNGQDITSGVYLYAVSCGDETKVGRFTVIR